MWESRLKGSGGKCLVLLCIQIWIGNIGPCAGRHIKVHGTVTGDAVVVEGPEADDSSSFRRNLVRKNEVQNQQNQNHHYSPSSSLLASAPSWTSSQMHLNLQGDEQSRRGESGSSSSRQHNFFGQEAQNDEDGLFNEDDDDEHHHNQERYIASDGANQGGNQFKDQQGNYETDPDEAEELARHSLVNSYFDNEYSLRMLYSMECITPTKSKGYCSTFRSCVPSLFTSDGELEAPALAELISFSIGYCTMDVSGGSSNVLMKRVGNRFSAVSNRIICCPGLPPKSGVVSAESSAEKFNDFLQGTGPKVSIFEDEEHKQPLSASLPATSSHEKFKPSSQQYLEPEKPVGDAVQELNVEQSSGDEDVKGHYSDEPTVVSDETLSIPISKISQGNDIESKPQPQISSETDEVSSSELGNIYGNSQIFKHQSSKPEYVKPHAQISAETAEISSSELGNIQGNGQGSKYKPVKPLSQISSETDEVSSSEYGNAQLKNQNLKNKFSKPQYSKPDSQVSDGTDEVSSSEFLNIQGNSQNSKHTFSKPQYSKPNSQVSDGTDEVSSSELGNIQGNSQNLKHKFSKPQAQISAETAEISSSEFGNNHGNGQNSKHQFSKPQSQISAETAEISSSELGNVHKNAQNSKHQLSKPHYSKPLSQISSETDEVSSSELKNTQGNTHSTKPQYSNPQASGETDEFSSSELGNIHQQNNHNFQNYDKNVEEKLQTIPIEAFIPPEKFDTYDPQTNTFSDQLLLTLDGSTGPEGSSNVNDKTVNSGTKTEASSEDIKDSESASSEVTETSQISETLSKEVNLGSEILKNSQNPSSEIKNPETLSLQITEDSETDKNFDQSPHEYENSNEESPSKIFSDQSDNSTIIKISPEPVKGANGKFTLDKGVIIEKATSETPRPKPNPAFQTQIGETTVNMIKPEVTIDSNPVLITPPKNPEMHHEIVHDDNENTGGLNTADVVQVPTFSAKIPEIQQTEDNNEEIAHSDDKNHEEVDMDDEDSSIPTTTYKNVFNKTSMEDQNASVERTTISSDDALPTTLQDSNKFEHDDSNNEIQIPTTFKPNDDEIFNTTPIPNLPAGVSNDDEIVAQKDDPTQTSMDKVTQMDKESQSTSDVQDDEISSYTTTADGKLSNYSDSQFSTTYATIQVSDHDQNNSSQSDKIASENTITSQNHDQEIQNSEEAFPGNSLEHDHRFPVHLKDPSSYELQSVDDSAEIPPHFSSVSGQKYRPNQKPITTPISGAIPRPALFSPLFPGSAAKVPPQVHEDDSLETEHNPPYPPSTNGWSIDQLYQSQDNKTLETEFTKPLAADEDMKHESNKLPVHQSNHIEDKIVSESNVEAPAPDSDDTSASTELESGSSESLESHEKEPAIQHDSNQIDNVESNSPSMEKPTPESEESPLADPIGSQDTVLKQSYPSSSQSKEEASSPSSANEPENIGTVSGPQVIPEVTPESSVPSSSSEVTPESSFPSSSGESYPSEPSSSVSTSSRPGIPGSAEMGGLPPQDPEGEGQPEYQILSSCATQDYYRSLEQDSLRQYPFLATIVGGSRPFCSGTLITDRHILTAAHFLSNITVADVFHMRVHVGYRTAYGGQTEGPYAVRKVLKVIRHKGFSFDKLVNDIAILVLDRPIRFSEDVHPVCLSNSPHLYSDGMTEAFETGWMEDPLMQKISPLHPFVDPHILKYFTFGYENVTWTLQEAVTRIRTNDECQANYGFLEKSGISITDSMVCAAAISEGKSCSFKGNSGAPLFISNDGKPIQVGLVSWGIGCGHFPAVFTGVSSFLPWIEKVVYRTS